MADETGHRRQWQPDRCYPVESYQISIWVAVAEVRYPPALFGVWSSSLLFTPIVIFDYLNVGTGIPWASHNKASLNDDFIRMISDLLRGGRRGGTLVIGSSKHDDGYYFLKNSHWNQINGTTHCLNVSTGLTLKKNCTWFCFTVVSISFVSMLRFYIYLTIGFG